MVDASCGDLCDTDGDGVPDPMDKCPNTPPGAPVNRNGCADSQLTPMLETAFPPYGLLWTNGGDLGHAGGLLWTYSGITKGDLFHIWWVLCDDPSTPCGVSLNGPIDAPGESWTLDATNSSLATGKLVFTNSTGILLASGMTTPLTGQLTVTITDGNSMPIPFATVSTLGIPARQAMYGAEITGTEFKISALIEVKDATSAFMPYLDYYDAASTPTTGGGATVSFGGSFYDK